MKITEFLRCTGIPYTVHHHVTNRSALERARSFGEEATHVAKPVLLKVEGEFAVAILPAGNRVDFAKLCQALDAEKCSLATAADATKLFFDCEAGIISPFGSRYGIYALADCQLAREGHLLFPGSRQETIHMLARDFYDVETPEIVDICSNAIAQRRGSPKIALKSGLKNA